MSTLTPPQWDERLSQFIDVRQVGPCEFQSVSETHWIPVFGRSVFGGTLIAQSMEAAYKTVDEDMELHGKFLRGADAQQYIDYHVTKVRDGRSFSMRRVDAMQGTTLLFMATLSFQAPEWEQPQFFAPPPEMCREGSFELMEDMPSGHQNVPSKVLLPDMSLSGTQRFQYALTHAPCTDHHYDAMVQWTYTQEHVLPVEFRPAVPTIFGNDGQVQFGSKLAYWLRARGTSPGPANRQRAILGFHIDQFMLGSIQANVRENPVTMMTSLDHTMWFYNHFSMSEWLLMVVENQAMTRSIAVLTHLPTYEEFHVCML
ncbi:palmitoyl-CoA hydrolase [Malassezia equina]|uniref:Palmitoyl-CoA hydrolase n=1 Tax=Malassezia equina TaxID=1381935 RepID=A0AAF0IYN9_9BASI|nr:palmitoyl-CoA hydrolase [Malassezia equina]